MKTHIKILMMASLILLPYFYSCSGTQNPVKIVFPPEFGENEKPQSTASSKRFEQQDTTKTTAIEAAVEMSQKYAQLSVESTELKRQNETLQEESRQIHHKLEQTQTKLDSTQRELDQANDLIMEMQVELNNWKADVLGFREEMRQADIAQLQTLQKVLEILGGEVPGQIAVAEAATQSEQSQADPNTMQ